MTRITLAALIVATLAGSAFALVPQAEIAALEPVRNETVIQMNQLWPISGALDIEECATPTCEDQ